MVKKGVHSRTENTFSPILKKNLCSIHSELINMQILSHHNITATAPSGSRKAYISTTYCSTIYMFTLESTTYCSTNHWLFWQYHILQCYSYGYIRQYHVLQYYSYCYFRQYHILQYYSYCYFRQHYVLQYYSYCYFRQYHILQYYSYCYFDRTTYFNTIHIVTLRGTDWVFK